MKYYKVFGHEIENSFKDLDKHCILVSKEYIDMLIGIGVEVSSFSDIAKDMVFVKDYRGKKEKKFNKEEIELIKKDHIEGLSYRKLSEKYKCSTAIIYKILKDKY